MVRLQESHRVRRQVRIVQMQLDIPIVECRLERALHVSRGDTAFEKDTRIRLTVVNRPTEDLALNRQAQRIEALNVHSITPDGASGTISQRSEIEGPDRTA